MRAYLDLMRDALENGAVKDDRTGTGVRSLFGRQIRFDLSRGLSPRHHQAAASEVDRPGAHLVPATATPTSPISRRMASRSGTNGPTPAAISARSMASNGAPGRAGTAGPTTRSTGSSEEIRRNPEFAPPHRLGLERARHRADEAAALPLPVPVQRDRRQAVLPALSALGRHLPRRAVQHRKLRPADPPDRARMRPRRRRLRPHLRRRASLPQPRGPGARAACARAAAPAETACSATSGSLFDLNAEAIAFEGYEPWPAIKAPVAV